MSQPSQESLVLTGSVIQCYRRLESTGIQDPRERLADYLCAIVRWLDQPEIDQVIYCDASGFLIPNHLFGSDCFHSYAVDLRSVALNRGKGPAECETIEYLLNHCDSLPKNFFKCTGRLFVKNFSKIFERLDRSAPRMGMNKDACWADTRLYWLNRDYYSQFIQPHLAEVNDYAGWFIEYFYANHCLESQAMPEPVFVGRFGHDGRVYHEDYSDLEKEQAEAWIDEYRLLSPVSGMTRANSHVSQNRKKFHNTKEITMENELIYEDDMIAVRSATVGYGKLGINELGYAALDLPDNMSLENHLILSGHCPSKMSVTFKTKASIKGVMNGSSVWSPVASCLFLVSDNIVGYLFGPKDTTREMILEPGDYTLETTSLEPGWKHSLWAIREIPEI